jgi:lipopolysaccharide biosynthesis glycosyltransferase
MAFDEAFALGAETSLYSVLRHNHWFDARVIVLADGLSDASCVALRRLYGVEFVNLDPALVHVAERVVRSGRVPRGVSRRLYLLQLFNLSGLERAVFLDADTLCLGDVRALFELPHEFAAAPDLLQLERELRPECAPELARPHQPYGRELAYSFNTGVLSVSSAYLRRDIYLDLLQAPGLVESAGAPQLADQYLLNRFFDGKVVPLDPRYNFIVSAEALLRQRYSLTLPDVRILHFAGYTKPWELSWDEARRRVPSRFLRYYETWYELRQELTAELTNESAFDQYRAGLGELSLSARLLGRGKG